MLEINMYASSSLNQDISNVLMGGEKENILFISFSVDEKVKKGELTFFPSFFNVTKIQTSEQTNETFIVRTYKRPAEYEDFILICENISVNDNIHIRKSFIKTAEELM